MKGIPFHCYIFLFLLLLNTASASTAYLSRQNDQRLDIYQTTITTPTALRCCLECTRNENCAVVNYNAASSECQMSAFSTVTSSRLLPSDGWSVYSNLECPVGWDLFGVSCFMFNTARKRRTKAKAICESYGGTLARIKSAEENNFVSNKIQASGYTGQRYFIDGSDKVTEGTWLWSDGLIMTYFNWAQGEPNNVGNEDYLMMAPSGNYTWTDIGKPRYIRYSICEIAVQLLP